MRRTIRARATFNAVLVMATTVLVASVALTLLLERSLRQNVDTRATLRLEDVADLARRGNLPDTLAGSDEDGTIAQVIAGGRVLTQSPIVQGSAPLANVIPAPGHLDIRTVGRLPVPESSTSYRLASLAVDTPTGPAVVYVAAGLEPTHDSINALKALLAIVGPLLVLVVGAMTWWLIGRTLRPVEAIRRRVTEISASDLTRRVPEPATRDEIHRLAQTMNDMLARVDDAVTRQRSFVSDAAHELRSPLAAMHAELDVAAAHAANADWPGLVDRLARGVRRMEHLVEDLLSLATAEERGVEHRVEVDLDDLVLRQVQSLRATSRLTLDIDRMQTARVRGDRDQLEQVVANLFHNAERFAATTIAVELHSDNGTAELVVADDGPGIPVTHRERIFDRFARVDEARDRERGGAGLGLAITRRIVESHGGSIAVAPSDRGARLVVRLPTDGNRAAP